MHAFPSTELYLSWLAYLFFDFLRQNIHKVFICPRNTTYFNKITSLCIFISKPSGHTCDTIFVTRTCVVMKFVVVIDKPKLTQFTVLIGKVYPSARVFCAR